MKNKMKVQEEKMRQTAKRASERWTKRIKEQCKRIIHGTKTKKNTNVDIIRATLMEFGRSNLSRNTTTTATQIDIFGTHYVRHDVEMCKTACATSPNRSVCALHKSQSRMRKEKWGEQQQKREIIQKRTEAIYSMQSQNTSKMAQKSEFSASVLL